ncbi:MAG: Gfo/Idh/MocA family oxidoreductase [Chitinophagales bacterium]|nr:Gfo/Idh/MocA family oxidoreductase [Chitinophagales bacterium]MDW8419032.1 Gfo/Idh/MocA family oxidoreductase [Chitinophagales bacterium]
MFNFALIGSSGYIAPRHLKAIKDTGNCLLAAYDPYDSAGILDSYFPEASFFVEFERFDRHIDKLKRKNTPIHYLSICSPNYLHDSHIRFGLKNGADVICEKPLVLHPKNAYALLELEKETGHKVNTILQLRLHESILKLKNKLMQDPPDKIYDFDLTYITSRGKWYYASWKGDIHKSGGIATNIGIHFFDMLCFLFGEVKQSIVHLHTHDRAAGFLELSRARVRWFLSINAETLPQHATDKNMRTYRSMTLEGEEIEFSEGFTDLHTRSYEEVLRGNGFSVTDALPSIELTYSIRNATPVGLTGDYHPLCKLPLSKHPFY